LEEKESSISETILKLGADKRSRMVADTKLSFRRYTLRMLLTLSFILLDGLVIPTAFQLAGLLTMEFVIPIGMTIVATAALQIVLLSRIK
jgi:hypothetical protein